MDLDNKYPALSDLRARARRRMPHFMWEYLDSATGTELGMHRNRAGLDNVLLKPRVLHGEVTHDLTTTFLGRQYTRPFGIAPVGMSGAMWPGAEGMLARLAVRQNIPFCLSTMATRAPEDLTDDVGTARLVPALPPRPARDPEPTCSPASAALASTPSSSLSMCPANRDANVRPAAG